MQSRLTTISLLILLCCGSSVVFAQDAKKKNGQGIAAWDRNNDGLLQPNEIPEKARQPVKKWAEKMDLDPNKPLPLDKLLKSKASGKATKPTDAEKAAKKEIRKKKKLAESDADEKKPERVRKIAGFGKSSDSEDEKDGSEKKPEDEDGKKLSARERWRQQNRERLVNAMMFQNDKNRNGRLEKNEWAKLKGNPAASDANKDGVLSKEELSNHLQGFGTRERDVTRRAPSRSTRAAKNKNGKSYRFLTPQERLPEGLPTWFADRDYNADGQISLSEYEAELTAAKVAKFNQLDLNRDGFIVAKEYLKATTVE